ncbi:DsrE family protein [Arthrobacter sunyaminii]|uniref:DsrE family protein n=1 Tax=Arthrobacter sunyaminii TaxID=2816859 RepID=A0A975S663_9MICC|nr:DsrE family protein [Arthrobacter sunyaminii]MBO0898060.1 DsrE family protein [Arthrobacter sunyaminii]MBO0909754.1 DsrE family protein [Arthrobacter sunyaminii]QWQ36550.1 DsrE family protein [Arthrobacter sunyaminii]
MELSDRDLNATPPESGNQTDAGARPGDALPGLVIHGFGPDSGTWLAGVLRSAGNSRRALGPERRLEVVVQGFGVRLLRSGLGDQSALDGALSEDIHVLACRNSMTHAGIQADELHRGVETVDAAVAHLARRQWEGWAYVRL